ncbi:MAG TPA: heavy-metal-associated domain-containing protein [Verrucomicrobiae bacterium]|nr:heavy-metal-associated domain-containing protein [Verrucomicrobiae bacterium]
MSNRHDNLIMRESCARFPPEKCGMFKGIFKSFRQRQNRVLETKEIKINGMTCNRCAKTIKKALLTKNGVKEVYINRESGVASVTFDPSLADLPTLHQIILRKGYFPVPSVE